MTSKEYSCNPLTGLFFLRQLSKQLDTAVIAALLQSPYGAFLFATCECHAHGQGDSRKRCNPLTGLFFLRREAVVTRKAVTINKVAIPLRGFSFCDQRGLFVLLLPFALSCNPLTGLFFLRQS